MSNVSQSEFNHEYRLARLLVLKGRLSAKYVKTWIHERGKDVVITSVESRIRQWKTQRKDKILEDLKEDDDE